MMGRIQDVQKPEGEILSNYSEDSLKILSAELRWNYLRSRLMKKTNEKGEQFLNSVLFFSQKREYQ